MGTVVMSRRVFHLLPLFMIAACARPDEVRVVATSAQPIVASIQTSAGRLEGDMADQRQVREQTISVYRDLQRGAEAAHAVLVREWRLAGAAKEGNLKRLSVLKEQDAQIIQDPLWHLKTPAMSTIKPDKIDVGALAKVKTGLDRMKTSNRMTFEELANFAHEISEERAQIDAATDAAPK